MRYKILLICLLIVSALKDLSAQSSQACPPGQNGTISCQSSCISCDLNGVTDRNVTFFSGGLTFCSGDLVTDNARWYSFIAGTPNLILGVKPSNCNTNQYLEYAMFDGCPNPNGLGNNEILCMGGLNPPAGFGYILVSPPPLVVGRRYILLVDGFNGDVCDYQIDVLQGSTIAPALGPMMPIQGPATVCPNATVNYSITPVQNALTYTWIGPAGSSIENGGNVMELPATLENATVEITFGSNGGNVCVVASNACSAPVTTCLQVSNVPLATTILPDETVCNSLLPYLWAEEPHNYIALPGTYNLTSSPYVSYQGCDSIVKQKLIVLPPLHTNLGNRYICEGECFMINGSQYCEPGLQTETFITDNGCDSVVLFNLVRIPVKAVATVTDTITCAVTSVPLSGAGSTTGNAVMYQWLNPSGQQISTTINAVASVPGQHRLIVSNTLGGVLCYDTAFVQVQGNLTPPLANAGPDMVLTCANTQVQLQGTGSTGSNFSYFWTALLGGNIVSGVTTLTPTVNAAGTYRLRVTNNLNGCSATNNADVTSQIVSPNVTANGGTSTCLLPNVTLQVSTDAPNPSYSWAGPGSFSSNLQNPTVSMAGTYTVTVTNGITFCTATANATVISGTDIPDVQAVGGAITCTQDSVTLAGSSSFPGVSYQWSGPGGFNSNLQNPKTGNSGTYQLIVTAQNGCSNSASAAVTINNTLPGTTLATSGNLNCNNASINLLATSMGNGANLVHIWTLPGGNTQNTGSASFLSTSIPGLYNVVVTNTANGCSSSANATVVQHPDVLATIDKLENNSCFGISDGSLGILPTGGNGTYTFNWSNGPNTSLNPNLGPGVYFVTVTDGEGCTATASATIVSPAELQGNATATGQTSNGASDGTATANPSGGTPPYAYFWSNNETTQSITGLLPGIYSVTINDANGCTDVNTVNVNQFNCLLTSQLSTTNATCFGAANGSASISIQNGTDPTVVNWSNGQMTNSISNLAGGSYSVTITDAANCQDVQTFDILEPNLLAANASSTNTTGPGLNDGTATANPTGGTGAYTYLWSTTEITNVITGLSPGLYTVTVQDANGCTAVKTVEVTGSSCVLSTNFQVNNPTCNGSANGTSTVVLTGGSGTFTYAWSSGGSAATETGLSAGTYTVTVTDADGCTIASSVSLSAPPAVTLTLDSSQPTACANLAEGSATVSATGGVGTLSITWNNGQVGPTATNLTAGTYTAVATDDNACSSSLQVIIAAQDVTDPIIVANNTDLSIGISGNVVLTTDNLGATVTDNCALNSVVFQPAEFQCTQLGDHVVTITATDNSGNTSSSTITVTVIDDMPPTLICSPSLVNCFENNPVSYQAPTATDNCLINGGTFNITAGLPIGAVFPLGSTTTTYTFTDSQGNVGSCSFEVTILSQLTLEVDSVYNDLNNQNIGAIFINPAGSLPPYTYVWTSNGQQVGTDQNLTGIGAGTYNVMVTDDNGCSVASQTIVVSNTSGVNTPNLLEKIRIFPNPTAGNLTLLLPSDLMDKSVDIQAYDQTGKRVLHSENLYGKQIDLLLNDLAEGLYSFVIRIEGQQIVRNIVLSR